MLGELLCKIRKDKHFTKAELSRDVGINIGHVAHIEKEDRMPSHNVLKRLCESLDVPYQQLMFTYDKDISDAHRDYNILNHIAYNSILAIDNVDDLLLCPSSFGTASFALKVQDDSMEPTLRAGSYAFIECNSPLNNQDIGLFYCNNSFYIRRFCYTHKRVLLQPDNTEFSNISLSDKDDFYIIGKILGTNDDY